MENLLDLISGILKINRLNINADSGPDNIPNWDSLAHIAIITAVEQTYDIQFSMPEMLGVKKVKDIFDLLKSHGIKL